VAYNQEAKTVAQIQIRTVGDIRKLTEHMLDDAPVRIMLDISTGEEAEGFTLQGAIETEYLTLRGEDVLMIELDAPITWLKHG
jgi:hypothetical protein